MRQHAHVIDSTLNVKLVEIWLSSSGLGLGRCWTRNKSSVLKLGFNELTSMWLLCPWERLRIIVMSVSLSVREDISGTTHATFTKFLCMLLMAVAWSSSCRVTKAQGEGAILGVFFPLTRHCTAKHLGLIWKPLNWSRCRLGWWVGMARGTVCYVAVMICEGEGPIWGKTCTTSLTSLIIANWTGPCRLQQTFDCERCTSLLSAVEWDLGLHTAGKVRYLWLPCYRKQVIASTVW